ncbi:hypothetical protein [Papillibacter cinnamivorans]|uniref:Uncharacterized protein n=1 Tax=Papillibacter cinnamivorans DSM 12816 TaxID=1122930 RepID=A0A1W2B7G6_9FIRM|nr:hypothetical protein [Papillibacter cinnamivorans]SMC68876.1 hypothetical protein SAMN02745168_2071 [Papillibacter cinnamivorans DSM 12816]
MYEYSRERIDRKDRITPSVLEEKRAIKIVPVDCVAPERDKRIDRPDRVSAPEQRNFRA